MSKSYEIRLEDTVFFNMTVELIENVSRETVKMARYSSEICSNFLKPRPISMGLRPVSLSSRKIEVVRSEEILKKPVSRPKDIEIARFVELKAQNLGYKSSGIKLLPEKTGEIIEFTFERPKEMVKNIYKKEVYREAKSVC